MKFSISLFTIFFYLKSIWVTCIFQRYQNDRSSCQLLSLNVPKRNLFIYLICFRFNQSINLFRMYSYYLTNQSIKCFIYPLYCNLFLIYSWSSILPFMSYKVKPRGRRMSTANVNAIKGRRHWAQIPRRIVFNELKPSHTAIKTNDSKVNKENISGLNSYQWKSSCKNSSV